MLSSQTPSKSIIGCIVRLKNIEARPELNSRYANVEDYIEGRDRYAVRLLSRITAPEEPIMIKPDKIEVVYPSLVPDIWGSMAWSYFRNNTLDASQVIVNIPAGISTIYDEIHIIHPCLIRGIPNVCRDMLGGVTPQSCISGGFNIRLQSVTALVEIEDISFTSPHKSLQSVACLNGQVVFRRCRFKGNDVGVGVYAISDIDTGDRVSVIFENCTIDSCVGSGALITSFGNATFLNCIFINGGHASVEIRKGGHALLQYCAMQTMRSQGVSCYASASCEIHDSSIDNSGDSGILVSAKSRIKIVNCVITNCKMAGIAVQNSRALIKGCTMSDCVHGLLAQGGKNDVIVKASTMRKCSFAGVFIGIDCTGNVSLTNCTIIDNKLRNIENDGLANCNVTVDGETFHTNGSQAMSHGISPSSYHSMRASIQNNIQEKSGQPTALANSKVLQKAGLTEFTPKCNYCSTMEPINSHFKKCSQCLNAVYCSEPCQRQDWKTHKLVCKKRVRHPSLLNPELDVIIGKMQNNNLK